MRGLASRNVRPCLRQASSLSHIPLPPSRRTILPFHRKSITSADAFAILLPSILTAAFVVDVARKKDRTQKWDRQIAVVEAETERLRHKQLEAWSRIQRRSVQRGAWQQRRLMSSQATAAHAQTMEVDDAMDPLNYEANIRSDEDRKEEHLLDTEEDITEDACHSQKRFERLVATRLALQFMLQLRTHRTNLYTRDSRIPANNSGYIQSMDYLVSELEKIQSLIGAMKPERIPTMTPIPEEDIPRKMELSERLEHLTDQFRVGDLHLPDFVMSYVQLIAEYKLGPYPRAYVLIMRIFSRYSQNSAMAAMCETALWEGHQRLNVFAVTNMLFRHGSDSDAGRFTELLDRFIKLDSFPRPTHFWFRVAVNDVHIAVPSLANPYLESNLIRAALCNQQQTIAEAYATVFFQRDAREHYNGLFKWWVVANFLQSYGIWGSWKIGQPWLQLAIRWAKEFWEVGDHVLGRVILRMLDFCVAHNRQDEYNLIMNAATQSSIRPPDITLDKPLYFTQRMSHIRLDWVKRSRDASLYSYNWRPLTIDNIKIFQGLLDGQLQAEPQIPQAAALTFPNDQHLMIADADDDATELALDPIAEFDNSPGQYHVSQGTQKQESMMLEDLPPEFASPFFPEGDERPTASVAVNDTDQPTSGTHIAQGNTSEQLGGMAKQGASTGSAAEAEIVRLKEQLRRMTEALKQAQAQHQ